VRNALIAMTVTADPRLDEAIAIAVAAPAGDVVGATVAQIERWRAGREADAPRDGSS
jgi:hypothetical protein